MPEERPIEKASLRVFTFEAATVRQCAAFLDKKSSVYLPLRKYRKKKRILSISSSAKKIHGRMFEMNSLLNGVKETMRKIETNIIVRNVSTPKINARLRSSAFLREFLPSIE